MADFVPGQNLCRAFYEEVLAPKVEVPHSAGLLGAQMHGVRPRILGGAGSRARLG